MGRGRPPMPVGTYGSITITNVAPSKYRARARVRDRDGRVREVARFGATKGRAERALKTALAERVTVATGGGITRDTRMSVLAETWRSDVVTDPQLAINTQALYSYAVDRYVVPRLGSLRISEAGTGAVQTALDAIAAQHGRATAKTARAVLNGMFKLAARHDAITVNPVREAVTRGTERKPARALTRDEAARLLEWLRRDKTARERDLPDLVEFLLGTGARIGEACAVRDSVLDLDAGTVEIDATVVRIKGHGLVVQERPKTAAGRRVLALPANVVELLHRRQEDATPRFIAPDGVVFAAPLAPALRDPSNTAAHLRQALDAAGLPWASSHTFRKTVATWLDAAGWTNRAIADQLGHAHPSMTSDVYMGRKLLHAAAADVLARCHNSPLCGGS